MTLEDDACPRLTLIELVRSKHLEAGECGELGDH